MVGHVWITYQITYGGECVMRNPHILMPSCNLLLYNGVEWPEVSDIEKKKLDLMRLNKIEIFDILIKSHKHKICNSVN